MLGFLRSKTGEKLIDKVSKGIDKAFFTKEEKAEHQKKLLEIQNEALRLRMNLSSRTRRWLAWSIMGVYLFFIMAGGLMVAFELDHGEQIIHLIHETSLGELAIAVGGVYFGAYGVSNIIKSGKS